MRHNIKDLKSRTLIESNILKQFILSASSRKGEGNEFKPRLDDILIHDYQIANSVTLNIILSNYIVDLKYAINCIQNPLYGGTVDSYFKLVRGIDENNIDDQTKLILDVSDGNGTFKSHDLMLDMKEVWNSSQMAKGFFNLDSIWYSKKEIDGHDSIVIQNEMNNVQENINPFGSDPFDKQLYIIDEFNNPRPIDEGNTTFNQWLTKLNCIIENRFYHNILRDETTIDQTNGFGWAITNSRYLFCTPTGFYGLQPYWNNGTQENKTFLGFILHDIGHMLPILGGDFNFKFCSFHVIRDEETTLFLVVRELNGEVEGKYHYLYLNESSLDEVYGFTEIDSVVVDQLIVSPSEVFSKVENIRELGTINIAMTDYGFWDVEINQTNNATYSYQNTKSYEKNVETFNGDSTKLITPTISLNDNNIKYCEYSHQNDGNVAKYEIDRLWNLTSDNNWYECDNKQYRNEIDVGDANLSFFGATKNFAVYNHINQDPIDSNFVYLLVNLSKDQFKNLLFSDPILTNYFIEWLYEQVTCDENDIPGGPGLTKGEWYLYKWHFATDAIDSNKRGFIANLLDSLTNKNVGYTYDDLHYQLNDISSKFSLVVGTNENPGIVDTYDSSANTMSQYCTTLNNIIQAKYGNLDGQLNLTWLTDKQDAEESIKNDMYELFSTETWEDKRDAFVEKAVESLVEEFPLLKYFNTYLVDHLKHDLEIFDQAIQTANVSFDENGKEYVITAIQKYIDGKVKTARVLGSYHTTDGHGNPVTGNSCYDNLDQYIYQNVRRISKVQAADVMSLTNALKEVIFAIQSTKFINNYNSFTALKLNMNAADLFTMTENVQFVALSKLVKTDDPATLNVNWSTIKEWMFDINPGGEDNCSDAKILKSFIRTQIYRPLFFKYDDYVNFTQDESAYKATTAKYFIDHDGKERLLCNNVSEISPEQIKAELEGDAEGRYTIDESKIEYSEDSNEFEYSIKYRPIKIIDNKFVMNDVEFYVVRQNNGVISSIYFNEFQNNTLGQNQVAQVIDNRFILNGLEYVIEDNEISIDAATKVFDESKTDTTYAKYKEWKCEIVDDSFQFDGTWYVLVRDANNKYVSVGYADNKDNKLIELYVNESGYVEYEPWDIQFQFLEDWQQVQIVKTHQSDVIDRLTYEWCEFDESTIDFSDPNKTYDWYVANELLRIKEDYVSEGMKLVNLGDGVLYNGALMLTTNMDGSTKCKIHFKHEIQNEDIVTLCELVKKYEGNEYIQPMGILFDRDLNIDNNRVLRGELSNGLVVDESAGGTYALSVKDSGGGTSGGGTYAFFVKDIDAGLNNINTAWTDYSNWLESYSIESNVAQIYKDENSKELEIQWGTSDIVENSNVKFTPIYKLDDNNNETQEIIKYLVNIDDGLTQYRVWINGDYVHFILNGYRYRVNLTTNSVDRLIIQDLEVTTIDFSTDYNPNQLRDNLIQNVKTTILNKIIQSVIDSKNDFDGQIGIEFNRPINLYLDMFTDTASLNGYVISNNSINMDSNEYIKFAQIYKNNYEVIDDSNMVNGNIYKYLSSNIKSTFGTNSSVLVVDSPSIEVKRIENSNNDVFTYNVLMDVCIKQNKKWMQEQSNIYDGKYVIANAIIKDMECSVTITPIYHTTDSSETPPKHSAGSISYEAKYVVNKKPSDRDTYVVEYNQIVYNHNGKTKYLTTPVTRSVEVDFSDVDELSLTYSPPEGKLKNRSSSTDRIITDEVISRQIKNIFSESACIKMFNAINNQIAETPNEFNQDSLYAVGSRVVYANQVWRCKAEVTSKGTWTGDMNWELDPDFDTREIVDNSIIDNLGCADKIWELDVSPDVYSEELISQNRGWTYIKGQTYQVSDDDKQLISLNGSQQYQIQDVETHNYENKTVIAVLCPEPGETPTMWEYKYLGDKNLDNGNLVLVDDISNAVKFEVSNVNSEAENTASAWIERTFFAEQDEHGNRTTDDGRVYNRDNFEVLSYLAPIDNKIKKVATSANVILEKSDVEANFALKSIITNNSGSNENRAVVLQHYHDEIQEGLPNRFHVRKTEVLNFNTSQLINLGVYEESIRRKQIDAACAANYVYLKNSPGFSQIGQWLTVSTDDSETSQINGFLITKFNGQDDKRVGMWLESGGKFTQTVTWDVNTNGDIIDSDGVVQESVQPKEFTFTFGVKPASNINEWNRLVGTEGTIRVKISDYSDYKNKTPTVQIIQGCTCYTMDTIPDTRTGHTSVDITEYMVYEEDINQFKASDKNYVFVDEIVEEEIKNETTSEPIGTRITATISFIPRVRVMSKIFALNLGYEYITLNSIYVNPNSLDETQYVMVMKDFGGNNIGSFNYGYLSVPLDIDDKADQTYYEALLPQINENRAADGLPEFYSIDDIPHRTINEYEWSYSARFELVDTPDGVSLNGDGLDWPVSLEVLPPGKTSDKDGEIFNRVYEVQTKVYVNHIDFPLGQNPTQLWIDSAAMETSINVARNKTDWMKLIYKYDEQGENPVQDECIPLRMRENIEKLVSKIAFLDNSYFDMVLLHLQTFLDMIAIELHQDLDIGNIKELCNFKYTVNGVKFKNYSDGIEWWKNPSSGTDGEYQFGGLFGYDRDGVKYQTCLANFNNHLFDEFKNDWRKLTPIVDDNELKEGEINPNYIGNRDYHYILLSSPIDYTKAVNIAALRNDTLGEMWRTLNYPPSGSQTIDDIFKKDEDETWSNKVRFINAIRTSIKGNVQGMFVANEVCNLFMDDNSKIQWYTFDATKATMDTLVGYKVSSDTGEYVFEPKMKFTKYPISSKDWLFKMLNRDFVGTSRINDAFAIHCERTWNNPLDEQKLWYVPQLDVFVYGANSTRPAANTDGILDMAYEQYGNRLYVLFNGDNHLYAYDNIAETKTFDGFVILKKETATLKLMTFNSMCIGDVEFGYDRLLLDYFRMPDEQDDAYHNWRIVLYGTAIDTDTGSKTFNRESWYCRPGLDRRGYQQYNSIVFGDSLFNEGQLRFHNISKNKDMYDILDINEVDGRYYGLFKNENPETSIRGETTYTIFKVESEGGIVQRLPWQILVPHIYKTNDSLYSLYAVTNEPTSDEKVAGIDYHPVLREISVPDSDEYPERIIDINKLFENNNGETKWDNDLLIYELLMDEFKIKSKMGQMFILTNKGFHKVDYIDQFKQLSIDTLDDFKDRLGNTLRDTIIKSHMVKMHDEEQASYFTMLKNKINQFDSEFTVFSLIPTEFSKTQDVGVIPNSAISDIDNVTDHRIDSIWTSTDILQVDGMFAQSDTNPGIITYAVSNPATIYDDDNVFTKSQRNPSIEGTEFYDFIYDQDGNTLLDGYATPFIYRINSNNTYDLYINIPTTRTKYLNRIAGTLKDNGTSIVVSNETRTRLNFLEEPMPNNLDESITRLRVFMDKKYISIGTVDLVEISGNSIPTQIYRDVPNNGLYDSIALESRWNGEVGQINDTSKDINKVMLEFECYGTDSQSIHIQGKTFINKALNENEYNLSGTDSNDLAMKVAVTFDPNMGEVDESYRILMVGDLISNLPIPTRVGYEFTGWWTSPMEGMGFRVDEGDTIFSGEWNIVYAHWNKILKSIIINGDNELASGDTSIYTCDAIYEDNSTQQISPTWSSTMGDIQSSGRFIAPQVATDEIITITAEYLDIMVQFNVKINAQA